MEADERRLYSHLAKLNKIKQTSEFTTLNSCLGLETDQSDTNPLSLLQGSNICADAAYLKSIITWLSEFYTQIKERIFIQNSLEGKEYFGKYQPSESDSEQRPYRHHRAANPPHTSRKRYADQETPATHDTTENSEHSDIEDAESIEN